MDIWQLFDLVGTFLASAALGAAAALLYRRFQRPNHNILGATSSSDRNTYRSGGHPAMSGADGSDECAECGFPLREHALQTTGVQGVCWQLCSPNEFAGAGVKDLERRSQSPWILERCQCTHGRAVHSVDDWPAGPCLVQGCECLNFRRPAVRV